MTDRETQQRGLLETVFLYLRRALFILVACRFAFLGAVLLVVLGPVSLWVAPSLLQNGLLVDGQQQVAIASFAVFATSAVLVLQMRVTWLNLPDRIGDWSIASGIGRTRSRELASYLAASRERRSGWAWWTWLLWVLMSLPLLSACFGSSIVENGLDPQTVVGTGLVGLVLCLTILYLATWLKTVLLPGSIPARGFFPFESVVYGLQTGLTPESIGKLPKGPSVVAAKLLRGPGYTFADDHGVHRPTPGHWELSIVLLLFLLVFLSLALVNSPNEDTQIVPIIAYIGLIIAISTAGLSGISFWLDRYRIPTTAVCVVISLVVFQFPFSRDYVFFVDNSQRQDQTVTPTPRLTEVIAERSIPKSTLPDSDGERTLIVVTAPGGGIHAAAWSAEVLTRLHARFPNTFWDSLGVVSAVSGGSVGSMIYLGRMEGVQESELETALNDVRLRAQRSSLEAVFLGATYHDFLNLGRVLQLGIDDRGTEVEKFWSRHLPHADDTLAAWGERSSAGKLPVAIFHAIEAKSGRRILLSPVVIDPSRRLLGATEPLEFRALGSGVYDMPVSRAVRLSATFPYITPLSRPELVSEPPPGKESVLPTVVARVGDGGYADNEGIVTAVESINELIEEFGEMSRAERSFDRILLIRIQASPEVERTLPKRGTFEPWTYAFLGPLLTLGNVRASSQAERGEVEIDLLESRSLAQQEAYLAIQELLRQIDSSSISSSSAPANARSANLVRAPAPQREYANVDPRAQRQFVQHLERVAVKRADLDESKAFDFSTKFRAMQQIPDEGPPAALSPSRSDGTAEMASPIQLRVVTLGFRTSSSSDVAQSPPLNWKLSRMQQRAYQASWDAIVQELDDNGSDSPLGMIEEWLGD